MERIGGSGTIYVDTRVIAATNRNLKLMVADREFRQDLYFRLNVFPIYLPPLRERPEDIPLLVDYLIRKTAHRMNIPAPRLAPGEIHKLVEYPWPGNFREVANLIEQAIIRNPQGPITLLLEARTVQVKDDAGFFPHCFGKPLPLDDVTGYYLTRVLSYAKGRIGGPGGAAELLGVNPHTLRSRMEKLGGAFKAKQLSQDALK